MNVLCLWLKAIRPYAYSASIIPVTIGAFYARASGAGFSGLRFVVALISGVLLHTAANLWNDYYDFICGVDRPGGGEGSGVLVQGQMLPPKVFRAAWICAVLGLIGGIWLAWQVGWPILLLGVIGLGGAWAYSAGRKSPKHQAGGEIWVFGLMGVGMTLGGAMSQTGHFSWGAIAAGLPAALLMTLILYANNLRDLRTDRLAGIQTLPMKLKPVDAKILAWILLMAPYLITGLMVIGRRLSPAVGLSYLTIPWALQWGRTVWRHPVGEKEVLSAARLHLLYGLLFAAGLWLD